MWSFLKSKQPAAARSVPILPAEVIEQGVLALSGRGVHVAVLYATMLGFRHELLREDGAIREFITLIQSPPDFTPAGIALAVHRVVNGTDTMCRGLSFETYVYGIHGENNHLRPILEPYRLAVAEFGAEAVFAAAEFDVASFIERTAVAWREADIAAIMAKLEEKRSHLAPLLMRARARGRNKYGDLDYTEFFEELSEFLKTYFSEDTLRFFYSYLPLSLCLPVVESWLVEPGTVAMPINGIDFEHWCAAQLEEQGWQVRVSKASGDQGIDIEAMRDGMLVAIQCKRYAQPIGNKSVQEAYTGATHYRADKAVVIGTGSFTKAAIELAENTGVVLLDAENIAAFSSLMTDRS